MMRPAAYGLLVTAAAFAPLTVAAADLPSKKAAPVEYVRVCSVHGEGFFYIPGTDTCLQVGGRVRAEYRYVEPKGAVPGAGRNVDVTGFRAIARIILDSRTATAYGTLRAFLRIDSIADRGNYGTFTGSVNDRAFIQFAGITAGRVQSFFDFYANDWNYGGFNTGSDTAINVLAYTASFGGGFSATLSLEDPTARRVGGATWSAGGSRLPEVVGSLLYQGAWGTAQLSGALHQLYSSAVIASNTVDTEYGWAIQGGLKINLPMLAAGDVLWLQGAYSDGALSYLGINSDLAIGRLLSSSADAVIVGTELEKTSGYSLTAALTHYWTPNLRSSVLGNYTDIEFDSAALGFADSRLFTGIFLMAWTPVSGFEIGGEISYAYLDPRGVSTPGSEDIWEGRLRFQRDF